MVMGRTVLVRVGKIDEVARVVHGIDLRQVDLTRIQGENGLASEA